MQLALIPPRGLETSALQSRMHLVLAHIDHPAYVNAYRAAKARGDYIILDNGAAEVGRSAMSDMQLFDTAERRGANELVLPDVLHETRRTINAVKWALRQIEHLDGDHAVHEMKLMAVAQGGDAESVRRCIDAYAEQARVGVVGLPRLLVTHGSKTIRLRLAQWIQDTYEDRFEIHLLGTNPIWPAEVKAIGQRAPFIRSVDTSMPYNYTFAGKHIGATQPALVKRPDNYFDQIRPYRPDLLSRNFATLMEWTNGGTQTPAGEMRGVSSL